MKAKIIYFLLVISLPLFSQVNEPGRDGGEDANNPDVLLSMARQYGWEGQYDSASIYINRVLSVDASYAEAVLLNADILYWKNDWTSLESFIQGALQVVPGNETLLYYQALAVYNLERRDEAEDLVDAMLSIYPENTRAADLKQQLQITSNSPEIFVAYFYDHFEQPYTRNWHMTSLGAVIPYSKGSFSPYVNAGNLFSADGTFIERSALQLNLDSYFLLGKRNYLLAGYGYAFGDYIARHRAVLNIWQVLPRGWSVSAGGRYFYWDQHFAFLSLGVEKYLGDFWFQLNNYVFFKDYGTSLSTYLTARKYFAHKYNYLSATIGYGTSPDEPLTSIADLQRLNAMSLRLSMMRVLKGNIRMGAGVGYMYEEYLENSFRSRIEFQAGIYFKIN